MERKEPTRDLRKEHVELSFETGVQQSLQKIKEALSQQDEVLVAVYGSAVNVGKTFLLKSLSHPLATEGYRITIADTEKSLATRIPHFINDASRKGSIIFLENEGLPFKKIDIKIFIRRPDSPFHPVDLQYADIVINNSEASDK